ncbi:carotenoid oxygenase family protein [[Mycobacterium] crassicus]|uniref:Dioxygenase n=1 Tax=[Mycobacterium] crassicus TaxID=2872309 RepID=A0ABU5XGT2_9MYCO|nr:carotenoid oxygenase family protein [Mycolicibacter sp. MYC098]MEB3021490.1 carotenoid oxygenase family protein [Mycolicibacter sp. MYC098]
MTASRHEYALWDAAYVLGSLSASDHREFETHLDQCPSCRDSVDELSGMPAMLSLLNPDDFAGAIEDDELAVRTGQGAQTTYRYNGSDRSESSGSVAVMQPPETVLPIFRTGNYAPVPDELTAFDLPVEGNVPAELNGWYLRNGPNPREAGGHWCTGDGMVHGVRLENGRAAWYRNRWVRTESFGQPLQLFKPDGSRDLHSSVANTHVIRHAGKTLALMESSLPYEITNDLQTLGVYDFAGKLADSMAAHPKICPVTGELHFFGHGDLFDPHVNYYRANADGDLVIRRSIDVPGMTLMHDFALTAEHVVFMDLPLVFNLDVALTARYERDLPFRWDEHYGARLGVLRRDDPYGPVRWFDIDPCYVFHIVNAFDAPSASGDAIVLHTVRYPEMWRNNSDFETDAVLWRWTVNLGSGVVQEVQLDDRDIEFPRVDDRLVGADARYAVTVTNNSLIRYDLARGDAQVHRFGVNGLAGAPGEAVFAPAPGQSDESAGWYLTYVYDPVRDGSDLVIIDATDFDAKPAARVRLPRRVPHGFHGNWMPD